MLIGASSAKLSPPFQLQVLWVARSISGLTPSSERGSWKILSPPTSTAAPSDAPQRARPAMVEMTRARDMLFLILPLEQAVVHADIAAQKLEAAVQQQEDQAGGPDHPGDKAQADQGRDQDIAIAGDKSGQQM